MLELLQKIKKVLKHIEENGTLGFLRRLSEKIAAHTFYIRRAIICTRTLDESIPNISPKINVTIRVATVNDLSEFEHYVSQKEIESFKKRFENGRVCLIALYKGKIVYHTWIGMTGEYEGYIGIKIRLNKGEGYMYSSYALPEYRGKGIHTLLCARRLRYLKERSCKRAVVVVAYNNYAARKTLGKVGFRGKTLVILLSFLGVKAHLQRKFLGQL